MAPTSVARIVSRGISSRSRRVSSKPDSAVSGTDGFSTSRISARTAAKSSGVQSNDPSVRSRELAERMHDVADELGVRSILRLCDRHRANRDELHVAMPELVRFDRLEPQAHQEVGALEEVHDHAVAGDAGADAAEQRMVLGEEALPFWRHEDWNPKALGEGSRRLDMGVGIEVETQNQDGPPG